MAAYFQYLQNETPLNLAELDNRICREVLGVEPHPETYHPAFEIGVSFGVACGRTLEDIAQDKACTPEARQIASWLLDQNITTDAWAGRR